MTPDPGPSRDAPKSSRLYLLTLGALGVVYGDIGTSPLYAFKQCFSEAHSIPVTPAGVLGVLSLILWSLLIVISLKYMLIVMRADNEGEGGILALMTLVTSSASLSVRNGKTIVFLGLFGAALLYGDGLITPAISVLSAVEGLEVATPEFQGAVVPITTAILIGLFFIQRWGTGALGVLFGPVIILWFSVLAVLGVMSIAEAPEVLVAVNPLLALRFFAVHREESFFVLGAVFLVVTGGEALYADMGHFGKRPIRLAWFAVVLPGLLLNYFGQGALLLHTPEAARNPFYLLAPSWCLYPLVGLATFATIIASQAVISGAFSLTRQALQLGYCPRMEIRHYSPDEIGQIYVPWVNWALLIGTVSLVLAFGSSTELAGAYGVAVSTTMLITTALVFIVARTRWGWSLGASILLGALLMLIDLAFFTSNLAKVDEGGWVPLLIGAMIYLLMSTWYRGRALLATRLRIGRLPLEHLLTDIESHPPLRAPGTAVFMDSNRSGVPRTLLHNLKHNHVLHEQVVILTVVTNDVPRVPPAARLEIEREAQGFVRIVAHYGFMETPNVPALLKQAGTHGVECLPMETTFFLGRESFVFGRERDMHPLRKRLFAFMSRNAQPATLHFRLPPNRVIEIGALVDL